MPSLIQDQTANRFFPAFRHLGTLVSAAAILQLLMFAAAESQQESPDLELEGYRIIGKDTRVFTVTGDRNSTVEFVRASVVVPREERDMDASKGLIGEDERIRREEDFTVQHGFYSRLDAESGLNTPLVLWGKASLDGGMKGGTIRFFNRMAKENTPTNSAPLFQDVDAAGYYEASFARFAVDGKYGREDDDIGGEYFRNRMRTVGRYGAGVTMNLTSLKSWDVFGRFSINGSNYEDSELGFDDDEVLIVGSGKAEGSFGSTILVFDVSGRSVKLADNEGTITNMSGLGEWLVFGSLGLKAGASVAVFKAPGVDKTEYRPRLRVDVDWALTPGMYLNVAYKPGVVSHSFSDLYGMNGLVLDTVPMLFEDRIVDVDGEFGVRFSPNLKGSLGAFYIKSKDMPLYSRTYPISSDTSAEFYEIVGDTEIDLTGARLRVSYERHERLVIDGSLTVNNTSWNYNEKAPYIPDSEASVNGALKFYQVWRLRGSLRYFGKHYVEKDSGEREDGFVTIDVGVDRKLWDERLSLYVDLRNLTDSGGAWWTSRYAIPGAGLYAGFKVEY